MDLIQIFVLSVVQGLTEFLPISSSAHLILVPLFTAWEDQGLSFDIAVHLGSLAAVLIYFARDLFSMGRSWFGSLVRRDFLAPARLEGEAALAWGVLLGTIPVGVAGLLTRGIMEGPLRSPLVIATTAILFGVMLGWADWRHRRESNSEGMNERLFRSEREITWLDILWIGLAQAVALIPGVSRSGITMTAGLMVGLSREGASRFSFLLSIPVIVLATGLESIKLLQSDLAIDWSGLALATLFSGISAWLCIHYFLKLIRTMGMLPFVLYRLLLGALLFYLFWPS